MLENDRRESIAVGAYSSSGRLLFFLLDPTALALGRPANKTQELDEQFII
jgi:hypothetical protein